MSGAEAEWELFTLGNSFLPRISGMHGTTRSCVNPLHLRELISTSYLERYHSLVNGCVNPLLIGELITTKTISNISIALTMVSIPFSSGNSFLRLRENSIRICYCLCQSPSRRGNSFLPALYNWGKAWRRNVSIPFTSGNSFLHNQRIYEESQFVSIPFTSGNSFLRGTIFANVQDRGCVNPLHTGELISTTSSLQLMEHLCCVNPLHTGELISTLTLIFCWFYAGFQPRFPGYFPDNSENGCFFGHFNIFKYFL